MTTNGHGDLEIVLRDLQSILRKKLGNSLTCTNYKTETFLPPGENYGSTILKVIAKIKRDEDAEEEDLNLVAKMLPATEFQRKIFDSPYTFRKEIFLYQDLIPFYQSLEIECGIPRQEVFDIVPEFYGSRLTMKPNSDCVDEDAVILMENMKEHGYYTLNRGIGLDINHSRKVVEVMARFHALGMAAKYRKPEGFEILKQRSKCLSLSTDEFITTIDKLMKIIREDPQISGDMTSPIVDRVEKSLRTQDNLWTNIPDEPWSTIIHADLWVNNILFHQDAEGDVDKVKFVDFQNYLFFSPLRELIFFLWSSTVLDLGKKDYDELLNLYYDTYISILKRMDCDVSLFPKEKFDEKLISDGYLEFTHCCFMLKIMTADIDKDNFDASKMSDTIIGTEGNALFKQKLRKLIFSFVERGWI